MGEWINTAERLPEENERVLIQLPTTKNYTVARHTDGAFYDGYLRYCNIDWWQRIDSPAPVFKPGDEVIVDEVPFIVTEKTLGVVVRPSQVALAHDVYIVDEGQIVKDIPDNAIKTTGVTYKEFVGTISMLEERQRTL